MKLHLAFTLACLFSTSTALATTTRCFRQTTAKDFEEGEAVSSMVLPTGEVVAGLKATRLPLDAAFAWCASVSPDGSTAYFGTGDQGRIYAVPMASGEPRKLAEIDAPWVTALLARADGSLLAGATPGGRIFAVDGKGSRPFAKLPAEHVWALLGTGKGGPTYAATGSPGQIFVVDAKGKERLLWDAGDKHVMALGDGGNGTLLAGTADQAILYRVYGDGHAQALQDFDGNEIRAIVRAQGATYLAVNAFERTGDAGPAGNALKNGKPAPGPSPVSGAQPRNDQVKAHAGVYRLDDSGRLEQVLSLADGYFTALVAGADGSVYAASGVQGKVYRLSPDRNAALALDLPERQVLSMAMGAQGFLVGTGDAGAVFRTHAAAGDFSYVSKVLDADSLAQWGLVHWTGSADLVFEARVGNTAKPDKSWGPWSKLQSSAHHDSQGQGKVVGPLSRYLQYRVLLPGKTSNLREMLAYFLPQNQRARITEITLADAAPTPAPALPGASPAAPPATPARAHMPTLKLRWKVENPDNDELIYKLWFRREDESVWRPLGGPEPLGKPEYDWNSESVPDGRYLIRVWASDEKVTPKPQALDFTLDSPSFLIDNNRPSISELRAQLPLLHGRAHDSASVIAQIEYAIDGNEWRPASPDDGILDERSEPFSIRLPDSLAPGPHIINVRAWDSADNLGTARIQVQVGR